MTFEELKTRIEGQDSVLLKCSPNFVKKMMNVFQPMQSTNSIILIARLFYNDNYQQNHKHVNGDVIGGNIFFHPKLNPTVPLDDSTYLCNERGNGEYGQMTMMVFNDEDCAEIEVLNLCVGTDCGI